MQREQNAMEDVSFETTCFGWDTATVESLDVASKLARVARLQKQVSAAALDPEQIGAMLFQGARLVTATATTDGELLGYAIAARPGTAAVSELLVSPLAKDLPVGTALLERLAEVARR